MLSNSVYSWTYRVAEWAWEGELAEAVAAAEGSFSVNSESDPSSSAEGLPSLGLMKSLAQVREDSSEADSSLSTFDMPPLRLTASLARALASEVAIEPDRVDAAADGGLETDSAALAEAKTGPARSGEALGMAGPSRFASAVSPPTIIAAPTVDFPSASALGHAASQLAGQDSDASAQADRAARGRWVLKGYQTHYAYMVAHDLIQQDNHYAAQQQSEQEVRNKFRERMLPVQGVGEEGADRGGVASFHPKCGP